MIHIDEIPKLDFDDDLMAQIQNVTNAINEMIEVINLLIRERQ